MTEEDFNKYIVENGRAVVVYRDGKNRSTKSVVIEPGTFTGRDMEFVSLGSVGYVRVNRFSEDAASRFADILQAMESLNRTGLIIDLRSLYTMDIENASRFIEPVVSRGLIARVKDKTFNASMKEIPFETAVLVDGSTTGAAEVVAKAVNGTVYGSETPGYAVYVKSYPMLTKAAYERYSGQTGRVDPGNLWNYLKATNSTLSENEVAGYLKIVESGVYDFLKGI